MQDPYSPPNQSPEQNQPFPPNQYPQQPSQTDGFSITSMVLGILGVITCYFGLILGTAAVIFGHISLNKIKKNPYLGGKGMAIAGLVCGYVSLAISVVIIIIFLAAGSVARDDFQREFTNEYNRELEKNNNVDTEVSPSE